MSYLTGVQENSLLIQCPFEHVYRNVSFAAFKSRLQGERDQCESGIMRFGKRVCVKLIIMVENSFDQGEKTRLLNTLSLWALQSCPHIEGVIVPSEFNREGVRNWYNSLEGIRQISDVFCVSSPEALRLDDADYLIYASPGDLHHPSLAYAIATRCQSGAPDVFTWNFQVSSAESGKILAFQRNPELERYTLWHRNYILSAVAFRSEIAHSNADLFRQRTAANAHLLHLDLSERLELFWSTIPEYLQITSESLGPVSSSDAALQQYESFYAKAAPNFDFNATEGVPVGFHLIPKQKPSLISVIIPFRDKPDITIKCIASVLTQNVSGQLELILINNRSQAKSLDKIETFLSEVCRLASQVKSANILHYDLPFNHSAQCNLGIEESTGDVLVFLNNDASLVSASTLDALGAWALQPGIGTVGCKIEDTRGDLICAGIKSRVNSGFDYNSSVEESRDDSFSSIVRETFANTFAFSAVSKDVAETVGGLNALEFPNGYNDVEFNLRVRKMGLKNLYVGTCTVVHEPGTTRGKCDEIAQKVLLRKRFPEIFSESLVQLENDTHMLGRRMSYSASGNMKVLGALAPKREQ